MSEGSSLSENTTGKNWVLRRKRKKTSSVADLSNVKEGTSVSPDSTPSNSSVRKKLRRETDVSQSADKIKGHDGYYFECVECDLGGNLLCCDSCPRTYHLECLNPPLECAPPGKWQCPKCSQERGGKANTFGNLEVYSRRARTKRVLKKTMPEKFAIPDSCKSNDKGKVSNWLKVTFKETKSDSYRETKSVHTDKSRQKKSVKNKSRVDLSSKKSKKKKSATNGLDKKKSGSKRLKSDYSGDSSQEGTSGSDYCGSLRKGRSLDKYKTLKNQKKKPTSKQKQPEKFGEFTSPSKQGLDEQGIIGDKRTSMNGVPQVDRVLGCRLKTGNTISSPRKHMIKPASVQGASELSNKEIHGVKDVEPGPEEYKKEKPCENKDSLKKETVTAGNRTEAEDANKDKYEFLVKWVGKSNIHNTWVTESELKTIAKRKLDNFKTKYGTALINICKEQWTQPQRVFSLRNSDDGTEQVLVKWCGLPYDECTWERADEPVIKNSLDLIDQLKRFESNALEKDAGDGFSRERADRPDLTVLLEQPKELKGGALFPHQLEALNWLRKCWYMSKNVILADEMGLGKTVSACAFLSSLYYEFKVKLPCLVLVPLSTMPNWLAEFSSWAPHLNVVEYHGGAKARAIIRQYEWHSSDMSQSGSSKSKTSTRSHKFNVLLTTYEMVLADASHLRNVQWEVLIVDEGHRLKNSSSKLFSLLNQFSFQHRVLLTGTPLQNNIGEMYNLLNFLQPVSFPSLTAFEEKFNDLTTAEKVDELKKLVAPHMLRRLKKDAMQNIPPKTERVVPVELTSIQAEYYRAMLTKNYQVLRNIGRGSGGAQQQSLLNIVMQLRKVCNHPYLIPGTEPESGSLEFLHEMRIKASAKLTLLHSMLKILRRDGHRVLVFSQMTKLLDILEDYLLVEFGQGTYERVDGSVLVGDRQAAITRFNEDKTRFVFLLSTRSCGLGINLATADTVIIYDSDFNPHADIQAMNRAHRIGQSSRLLVYRLVVRASVEERIWQLAKKKLMLDQLFVNKSGSQKEVEDILKWGTEELFSGSDGPTPAGVEPKEEASSSKCDNANTLDIGGEQKHRRRSGGLGDVYEDMCAGGGSTRLVWDENAIAKLLDRSNLQAGTPESADGDMENDMLGTVKSMDWNDELNEDPAKTEVPPNNTADGGEENELKEEEKTNGTEESEWDKLLRVRWEKYQIEEEASLGRGKRLRKAVSYRETFASIPSEAISEYQSDGEEPAERPEPEREYTPAGRAWKEKYTKLRARQKERIARKHVVITSSPQSPNLVPVKEEESQARAKSTPTRKEDSNSKTPQSTPKKTEKSPNHSQKRHNERYLDLSIESIPKSGPFVPNSVACSSNLLPVLGLCAPNAPPLPFKEPKNEKRDVPSLLNSAVGRSNETDKEIPPSRTVHKPPFFSTSSDNVLPAQLKNIIPDSYFPFFPVPIPPTTSGWNPFDPMSGTATSSFSSFQEKLGLPNLTLDGKLKPPVDLFPPNLPFHIDNTNPMIHDMPMPNVPPFLPQNVHLKQMQQMSGLIPPIPSLGQHPPPMPENHKKVLDSIMLRTQSTTNKLLKKRMKSDPWSEEELDSLWIGVRRHGRGNWESMLRDPKLKFSSHRTIEEMSIRWAEEHRTILDEPIAKPSAPANFLGVSDSMMARALQGSRFSGIRSEQPLPRFRSHLTDIQLGLSDLIPGLLPARQDPSTGLVHGHAGTTVNENVPSFDKSSKVNIGLVPPFRHAPFIGESSQSNKVGSRGDPLNLFGEPQFHLNLNLKKDVDDGGGVGSSKSNKLPHWLQEAVNVSPANVSLPQGPTLPPAASAVAESLRLLYGEEMEGRIPPFKIPQPTPPPPKDPRISLKKRRLSLSKRAEGKNEGKNVVQLLPAPIKVPTIGNKDGPPHLNLNLNSPSPSCQEVQKTIKVDRLLNTDGDRSTDEKEKNNLGLLDQVAVEEIKDSSSEDNNLGNVGFSRDESVSGDGFQVDE